MGHLPVSALTTEVEDHVRVFWSAYEAAEEAERQARQAQQEAADRIDALRLNARPTFPLPEHAVGIANACRLITEDYAPTSHHGDPCGPENRPYAVVTTGKDHWLSVDHFAPFTARRSGGKLWAFTEEEVQALVALVAEHGWRVYEWWHHDRGVSMRVTQNPEEQA